MTPQVWFNSTQYRWACDSCGRVTLVAVLKRRHKRLCKDCCK